MIDFIRTYALTRLCGRGQRPLTPTGGVWELCMANVAVCKLARAYVTHGYFEPESKGT